MTKFKLEQLIKRSAAMLQPHLKFASAEGVLHALAVCESSFGSNNIPRFEASYAPMGKYYQNDEQRQRYKIYGANACCSYSSFQILYPTACEQGFDSAPFSRSPLELSLDEVAIFYVIEFIKNRIIAKGATKIEHIPDAYNTGNFKDSVFNQDYTKKFMDAYNSIQHNADYSFA